MPSPHLSLHLPLQALSFRWILFLHSLETLRVVFDPAPDELEQIDASQRSFNAELKLKTLTLEGIRRGDCGFDLLWKSCKNLKRLVLYGCDGIGDDASLSSFVNCFDGLEEVESSWCSSIVNDIVMRLVENCRSLDSLLIHHAKGSREGLFHSITQSRCNLQKLDLCLLHDLEDNHLLAVAEKFKGLSSLRLNSCFLVTAEGLRNMALAMSNKLEELSLINCKLEPGLLTTLGQKFRILRKLDLSYNEMLVDEEFISMLLSCNSLRDLTVSGCAALTDASVVSMFESCKQLEIVDIMFCPGIGAEAVELFVLNCLQLRRLYVEESKISDVSRSWFLKKFIKLFAV